MNFYGMAAPLAIVLLGAGLSTSGREVFIPSWKTGDRQIHEKVYSLSLSCDGESHFEEVVRDIAGNEAFRLSAYPVNGCDGGRTVGWAVTLREIGGNTNLLKPSNDPGQDYFTSRDFPGLFSEKWKGRAPHGIELRDTRLIKVESFYCILTPRHLTFGEDETLRSVSLEIRLSNHCQQCGRR